VDNIPKNSCSYLSALDLLCENSWLRNFMNNSHIPSSIVSYLSGSPTSKADEAIL